MQTFLPYPDFADSAASLDRMRLGKQRVETMQIMKALLTGQGWVNHPATLMWEGYEMALLDYQLAVCDEWSSVRGYNDTCAEKTVNLIVQFKAAAVQRYLQRTEVPETPPWIGMPEFHLSHQSNLVRKDAEHYGPQFPNVGPFLDYYWPTQH